MRSALREIGIGLAVLVGLFVVVWVIGLLGDLTASPQLSLKEREARQYFRDFVATGFEKTVLREEMYEGNSWDLYSGAAENAKRMSEDDKKAIKEFLRRTGSGVGVPEAKRATKPPQPVHEESSLQGKVDRILSSHQGALDQLRKGVRHKRCLTPMDYEKGIEAEIPSYMDLRDTARLLLAHGRLEIERGRPDRAVQDYLDGVHFAQDMAGGSPTLIARMIGVVCLTMVMDQVARDLKEFSLDKAALQRLAETSSQLGGTWPPFAQAVAGEYWGMAISAGRLSPQRFVKLMALDGRWPPPVRGWALRLWCWRSLFSPKRAFLGLLSFLNGAVQSMQQWESEGWDKVSSLGGSSLAEAKVSPNPMVRVGVPDFVTMFRRQTEATAWVKLAGAAALLELYRLETGRYPSQLREAENPGLENLFSDPITLSPWHYRAFPDGDSAAIYSPGFDVTDDGFQTEDFSLVLPPPPK